MTGVANNKAAFSTISIVVSIEKDKTEYLSNIFGNLIFFLSSIFISLGRRLTLDNFIVASVQIKKLTGTACLDHLFGMISLFLSVINF